jgi:hypothetical protein
VPLGRAAARSRCRFFHDVVKIRVIERAALRVLGDFAVPLRFVRAV